jgi:hypothetical protein
MGFHSRNWSSILEIKDVTGKNGGFLQHGHPRLHHLPHRSFRSQAGVYIVTYQGNNTRHQSEVDPEQVTLFLHTVIFANPVQERRGIKLFLFSLLSLKINADILTSDRGSLFSWVPAISQQYDDHKHHHEGL